MSTGRDSKKATLKRVFRTATASLALSFGMAATAQETPSPDPARLAARNETASRFIAAAETGYSREIRDIRKHYAPEVEKRGRTLTVIDPDRFGALAGTYEYREYETIQKIAQSQGASVPFMPALQLAERMARLQAGLERDVPGIAILENDPMAQIAPGYCAVVPPSFGLYTLPIQQEGMPAKDATLFGLLHEIHHCLRREERERLEKAGTEGVPRENTLLSASMYAEMVADLGAFGDMIAEHAKPLSILDTAASFRKKSPYIDYYAVLGLEKMKQEIGDMGLAAFRKLDFDARLAFYDCIARDNALTAAQIYALSQAHGADDGSYMAGLKRDPAMKYLTQNFAHFRSYALGREKPGRIVLPLSIEQAKAVKNWDADRALIEKAAGIDENVGAESLVKARSLLLDELRTAYAATPGGLYPAMAAKLEGVYMMAMGDTKIFPLSTPPKR